MKKVVFVIPVLLVSLLAAVSCKHSTPDYYNEYYYENGSHIEGHTNAAHNSDSHLGDHYYSNDSGSDHYYDYHGDSSENPFITNDNNLYNYLRSGRWFHANMHDFDDCDGESYIKFSDWEILHYDCSNRLYDRGTFEYHSGSITIHYDNGDYVVYYIDKCCDNELVLRTKAGKRYYYVLY